MRRQAWAVTGWHQSASPPAAWPASQPVKMSNRGTRYAASAALRGWKHRRACSVDEAGRPAAKAAVRTPCHPSHLHACIRKKVAVCRMPLVHRTIM